MTTTQHATARPVTGRPVAAPVCALVVLLGYGGASAATWSASPEALLWVMLGGTAVLAVVGTLLLVVRDTFWMGVGMLAGAGLVAAADLVALLALADSFG